MSGSALENVNKKKENVFLHVFKLEAFFCLFFFYHLLVKASDEPF